MTTTALIVLACYLWGGIPSAYLAGRYFKGIDIRDYGSGNIGSANLMVHVGRQAGFWIGVFDCVGKGTLSVVVAKLMGQSLSVEAVAGLAAISGHNWSPYLRFTGGRGVATSIGVLVGLFMWKEVLAGLFFIGVVGRMMNRDTGFWTFVAMLELPLLAYVYNQPSELTYMLLGIALLLILKRLTTNRKLPENDHSLRSILTYRLLWDRDVPRREQWTNKQPQSRSKD